jgi:hypothetical protein
MKKLKLNNEMIINLISTANILRNHYIYEMNKTDSEILKEFYQKEIDRINDNLDQINLKNKTNF